MLITLECTKFVDKILHTYNFLKLAGKMTKKRKKGSKNSRAWIRNTVRQAVVLQESFLDLSAATYSIYSRKNTFISFTYARQIKIAQPLDLHYIARPLGLHYNARPLGQHYVSLVRPLGLYFNLAQPLGLHYNNTIVYESIRPLSVSENAHSSRVVHIIVS